MLIIINRIQLLYYSSFNQIHLLMTRKKRTASKKKSPRGLIYTLLLVCAVCLGYEPLIRALHLDPAEGLPALVGEWQKRLQLPDAAPSSGNPASPLPDDVLLPAPLEGTPCGKGLSSQPRRALHTR